MVLFLQSNNHINKYINILQRILIYAYGTPLASYYNIMEETKIKELDSIDFHTIALTSFDVYMMTTSGTYIKNEDLEKVANRPIKDFIIGDA